MVKVHRVFLPMFWSGHGRLPVSRAHYHLLDRSFYIPSIANKVIRKPAEQVWMGRPTTLRSKIARSGDQGPTKNSLPVSVYGYPSSQWMILFHEPLGESKTIFR